MLTHPNFDPVAIHFTDTFGIHWYGLMYVVGFVAFLLMGKYRAKKPGSLITPDQVDDILFYGALGVVLGGRIGYILFYNFDHFIQNPVILFRIWEGGMSFHGGLIGVIIAIALLARKFALPLLRVTDFIAPLVPLGLCAGRIGNFINAELWGRPTDVPWGMIFPNVDNLPRHPSQLYQAALEGLTLFLVLWIFSKKPRPMGAVSGLFLMGYALSRIIVEFFRVPDEQLGFVAFGWMTQGQLLSVPMLLLGALMLWWGYKKHPVARH
ncbi:MAG: prolipoprotein diacylglyceryl transferase [Proteobacteria bacterium]|nr:MAG: prolipoprotein diacylglyceryl transferase [Pseudomonadota bacterium]